MRNLAAIEARRARNALAMAERRIALMHLPGKVAEKDPAKRLLRLRIGETSDGQPILGPWARWQEAGAGGFKIHSEPDIDEQMVLTSFSGTVGAASIAMPATYDQDHDAPSQSSDTTVMQRGGGRMEIGPDGIKVIGNFRAEGGVFEHEDVNVGRDHLHTGDDMDGITGPPEQ